MLIAKTDSKSSAVGPENIPVMMDLFSQTIVRGWRKGFINKLHLISKKLHEQNRMGIYLPHRSQLASKCHMHTYPHPPGAK